MECEDLHKCREERLLLFEKSIEPWQQQTAYFFLWSLLFLYLLLDIASSRVNNSIASFTSFIHVQQNTKKTLCLKFFLCHERMQFMMLTILHNYYYHKIFKAFLMIRLSKIAIWKVDEAENKIVFRTNNNEKKKWKRTI